MSQFRLICPLLLLLASTPALTADKQQITCEMLCDELFAAIRATPDKMVMRLEEALVIKESCAAELVKTAITAVNNEPEMVRKIQETALEIAPSRRASILAAVQSYKAEVVKVAVPVVVEEIRRAELPDVVVAKAHSGEEIRRAQLPDMMEMKLTAVPAIELMNVPKAKPMK